jgi:hypothetical protein
MEVGKWVHDYRGDSPNIFSGPDLGEPLLLHFRSYQANQHKLGTPTKLGIPMAGASKCVEAGYPKRRRTRFGRPDLVRVGRGPSIAWTHVGLNEWCQCLRSRDGFAKGGKVGTELQRILY